MVGRIDAASPRKIDDAIARGVEFLYDSRNARGTWDGESPNGADHQADGGQWGGRTALATYALLASGESPNDPRLQPAIEFLRTAKIEGYYALGLRAQVWLFLPPTQANREAAKRDLQLNVMGMEGRSGRPDTGLYDYLLRDSDRVDMSVSQYGVLGVWAGAQMEGLTVNPRYWEQADIAWRSKQQTNGGWAYQGGSDTTPSMTAAGIATLFITQDYTQSDQGLNCSGNISNQAIDQGVEYLTREFMNVATLRAKYPFYTLYGIERIGVASGLKYLNGQDWFAIGADSLVRSQRQSGQFGDDVIDTSFGLLFLSRGREPVAMNKIKYEVLDRDEMPVEGVWNQRPRDVANAAHFAGRISEKWLNWQIIELSVASTRDLLDAPICYISGSKPLRFSDDSKEKLREYVNRGGMLIFNADCMTREFTRSVTELLAELFPQYPLRVLPDSHVIFTNQQVPAAALKRKLRLQGVSNGVRELALVIEDDFGKVWQSAYQGGKADQLLLFADIYQYSIDKEHAQHKGKSNVVFIDVGFRPSATISIARLKYDGNWNPEPGGWDQMRAILRNKLALDRKTSVDLQVQEVELGNGNLDGFKIAHLTGTDAITLDKKAIDQLKSFVNKGGLLVIDAAGGSSAFKSSIEKQLSTIWPEAGNDGGEVLTGDHPIFRPIGNEPFEVEYRAYAVLNLTGTLSAPRLRGIKVNGHLGVIYSPEDLSAGLVGNEIDGIIGYSPQTATALMTRIILWKEGLFRP